MAWVRTREWAQSKRDLRHAQAGLGAVASQRESLESVMSAVQVPRPRRALRLQPGSCRARGVQAVAVLLDVVADSAIRRLHPGGNGLRPRARGDWELWKAALLERFTVAPFAVGAYLGLRSVLKGFRGGWVGLAANLVLGVLAISMPIAESLTG